VKKLDAFMELAELPSSDDAALLHREKEDDALQQDELGSGTKQTVGHATAETGHFLYYVIAIVGALVLLGTLLYCVSFLPRLGGSASPTQNDIYTEYVENGIEKTGAVNFVTGMILDYRAFDTLGESFVLFTAVTCVLILLQGFKDRKEKNDGLYQPLHDPILRDGCSILVPLIFLLGIYVILNGSISPGGGFSGGAIMGAGLIVYAIAFGFDKAGQFFTNKTFRAVSGAALLTYCGSKTYSFLTGAMGVESVVPLGIPGAILSGGIIFILNVCVGLVVTCTMFGFYALFNKGEI